MHQRLFDDRMDLKENHRKKLFKYFGAGMSRVQKGYGWPQDGTNISGAFFPLHIDTILPIRYKTISSHKID